MLLACVVFSQIALTLTAYAAVSKPNFNLHPLANLRVLKTVSRNSLECREVCEERKITEVFLEITLGNCHDSLGPLYTHLNYDVEKQHYRVAVSGYSYNTLKSVKKCEAAKTVVKEITLPEQINEHNLMVELFSNNSESQRARIIGVLKQDSKNKLQIYSGERVFHLLPTKAQVIELQSYLGKSVAIEGDIIPIRGEKEELGIVLEEILAAEKIF